MPKREITVPVLPKPDVPNVNGVLFDGESLKNALDLYMNANRQHVLLQTEPQTTLDEDHNLDKLCGSLVELNFNEEANQYFATIKLLPNKNSGFVLSAIEKGTTFSLGTNKVGTLSVVDKSQDSEETSNYPEGTKYACNSDFKIISTSLLPDWVMEQVNQSNDESST